MFPKKSYVEILETLVESGFNFKFLLDNVTKGDICIRHDIDFSIDYAYEIAKEECNLNIQTSYFFTLNSSFYNILTPTSVQIIQEILEMGHKVSLHVDPIVFLNREKSFDQEISFFSKYFSTEIDIISLPALKWQSYNASFETGIYLLILFVVPDDFANHFIF